jgi:hypothetical protein
MEGLSLQELRSLSVCKRVAPVLYKGDSFGATWLEQQISSILSHDEDLLSILLMPIITRSLSAAGPHTSRQDFMMFGSSNLPQTGDTLPCSREARGFSTRTRRRLYVQVNRRSMWKSDLPWSCQLRLERVNGTLRALPP